MPIDDIMKEVGSDELKKAKKEFNELRKKHENAYIDEMEKISPDPKKKCARCEKDYLLRDKENWASNVLKIMDCGHHFHRECIEKWIMEKSIDDKICCPKCNKLMVTTLDANNTSFDPNKGDSFDGVINAFQIGTIKTTRNTD